MHEHSPVHSPALKWRAKCELGAHPCPPASAWGAKWRCSCGKQPPLCQRCPGHAHGTLVQHIKTMHMEQPAVGANTVPSGSMVSNGPMMHRLTYIHMPAVQSNR